MSQPGNPTSPAPGGGPDHAQRTRRTRLLAAALAVVLLVVAGVWVYQRNQGGTGTTQPAPSTSQSPSGQSSGTAPTETSDPQAARPGAVPQVQQVSCPAATVQVRTPSELRSALAAAQPGAVISLADGTYSGKFTGTAKATDDKPIWVCGGPGAILDAGSTDSGYGFHLDGATSWRLVGFTVRNAQKGVMVDNGKHVTVQGLTVTNIGDEGVHLRRGTTDSVVAGNTISQTGKRKAKFGEGVYVGTAESNWCDISGCNPDRSDRNVVAGNTISDTTAESVDIKEGTVGGFLVANKMSGTGMSDAKTNVNVKGNAWRISGNQVAEPPGDAFQTHEILDGWGTHNLFEDNSVVSGGKGGYVVALAPALENVVSCTNKAADGMQVSKTGCQ